MSTPFAELLPRPAGNGAIRIWLKSADYTRQLLLGASGVDPWESAAGYLAYFTQAHGLLKPDVAVLEVGDLFAAWSQREGGLASRLGNRRRASTALRKLLEMEAPKAVLAEVIEATLSHLRGQAPLVLAMPSPRAWLQQANRLAGLETEEVDTDAVEDAAMYVADLIRSVSTQPLSGLLLEEQADDTACSAEDIECYRSVINVARHYRWSLALRLPYGGRIAADALAGWDAVVAEAGSDGGALPWGRDVSAAFAAGADIAPLAAGQFYFVQIPPGQQPETVLDRLARLRSA